MAFDTDDLFWLFNGELLERVRGSGASVVVLVGPGRSGKTFFKDRYLSAYTVRETSVAEPGAPGVYVLESEEAMHYGLSPSDCGRGCVKVVYHIPWEEAEKYAESDNVRRAVTALRKYVGKEVRYVPPGLVRELLELAEMRGWEAAEKEVQVRVETYRRALEILHSASGWHGVVKEVVKETVKEAVSLLTSPVGTVALAGVTAFLKSALKRIDARLVALPAILEKLAVRHGFGCEVFSELGWLIAYRIAAEGDGNVEDVCRGLAALSGRGVNKLWDHLVSAARHVELVELGRLERGGLYPNVMARGDHLMINTGAEVHRLVAAGSFADTAREVAKRLRRKRLAVVVGPRGVGKSALAAYVLWKMLKTGEMGLIVRIKTAVEKERVSFLENFVDIWRKYKDYLGELLLLYDATPAEWYYERGSPKVPGGVADTVKNLLSLARRVSMLFILPSDLYHTLDLETRAALESHKVMLRPDVKFLREVIKATSDECLDGSSLDRLASSVAQLDEGHALVARLVGEELKRRNCADTWQLVEEVERLSREPTAASGPVKKAHFFIAGFINRYFDVVQEVDGKKYFRREAAETLAELFAVRRPFVRKVSPGLPILTPGIAEIMLERLGIADERLRWLSYRHHDLIETTIEILLSKIGQSEEFAPWRSVRIPRIKTPDDMTRYFLDKYGASFIQQLERDSRCWQKVAFITGLILIGHANLPRWEELAKWLGEDFVGVGECNVDYLLALDNVIPPLVAELMRYSYSLQRVPDHKIISPLVAFTKTYERRALEELLDRARKRDKLTLLEACYALGLAVLSAESDVDEKSATTALYVATLALHYVSIQVSPLPILVSLASLGEKAPHSYVVLLSAASELLPLDKDTVYYILNSLAHLKTALKWKNFVWPFVYIVETYSSILKKHGEHIRGKIMKILKEMCDISHEVRHRELNTITRAYILIPILLYNLEPHTLGFEWKKYCNFDDPVGETMQIIEKLAYMIESPPSDKILEEWAAARSMTGNISVVLQILLNELRSALFRYLYRGAAWG